MNKIVRDARDVANLISTVLCLFAAKCFVQVHGAERVWLSAERGGAVMCTTNTSSSNLICSCFGSVSVDGTS